MDVEADAARPAADALTAAEVEKMKVYDLKLALEARGLPTDGLKKVLKERLLGALAGGDDGDDGAAAPEPEPAPAPAKKPAAAPAPMDVEDAAATCVKNLVV